MYTLGRQQGRRQVNIWPGFVDALATLLLVIIFVLMVFMVAQFFLSVALSGKDQALERLQGEINELAELLSLERSANSDLRINVADLSSQLQDSLAEQDSLTGQLRTIMSEHDDLTARLRSAEDEATRSREAAERDRSALAEEQARTQSSRGRLEEAIAALRVDKDRLKAALAAIASQKTDLEAAFATIEANKETIEAQIAELAILKSLRDEMIAELTAAEAAIARRDKDLSDSAAALRDSQAALRENQAALSESEAALIAERQSSEDLAAQLSSTRSTLGEQEELAAESQVQVAILNRQIFALRQQLARISVLLDAADASNAEQQVMIKNLGQRLNVALASKVQELARYRSDFFGRLREILGDRQDISIVGDRFVFQSEVLFESGSDELGQEGQLQLGQLAGALREIAATIPENINWILRVDGHTDRAPIATYAFPSNWELSTARAISVVKFLVSEGIAPERLAATGFGEFQPLDPGGDLQAFRRNRRIELKLTQR